MVPTTREPPETRTRQPAPHGRTITSSRPAGHRDLRRPGRGNAPGRTGHAMRLGASRRLPARSARSEKAYTASTTPEMPISARVTAPEHPGGAISRGAHIKLIWLSISDSAHLVMPRTESAGRIREAPTHALLPWFCGGLGVASEPGTRPDPRVGRCRSGCPANDLPAGSQSWHPPALPV